QKRSMADMRSLGTAVESYSVDVNFYPISTSMASITSIPATVMGIEPIYIKLAPTKDGWGGLYYYGSDAAGAGSDYTIVTYAREKKQSSASRGSPPDSNCDIISQTGPSAASPEGAQP